MNGYWIVLWKRNRRFFETSFFCPMFQTVTQQPASSVPVPSQHHQQQPAAPRPSYAPLTALSSMQPPGSSGADHHPSPQQPLPPPPPSHHRRHHHHHHHGASYNSAFSAPPPPTQANCASSDVSDNISGKHDQSVSLPPPPPPPYAHGEYLTTYYLG